MNDIFAIGTRKKLRFPYKGACSIEQLWDLSGRIGYHFL